MSLYTKTALIGFAETQIAAAANNTPLKDVVLITKYQNVSLKGSEKFLKISIADWFETEGRGDEMMEHDCLFYLESFVRPSSESLADEESALDTAIEIMQTFQRALLANTDLSGAICDLLADKFKFNAGMSKLGATRFAVCILPIIINPMIGE